MKNQRLFVPVLVASVGGAVLWLVTAALSGEREAWDSSAYWLFAYPEHPWRWALFLFEAQLIAMCLRNSELGNLLPLGVILFAILALPGMLVAKLAARLSNKTASEVA